MRKTRVMVISESTKSLKPALPMLSQWSITRPESLLRLYQTRFIRPSPSLDSVRPCLPAHVPLLNCQLGPDHA
jgi:hypothetical protein